MDDENLSGQCRLRTSSYVATQVREAEMEATSLESRKGSSGMRTAAVAARKRWKFTPFVADGKTTRALTTITFGFRL